MLDMMDTLKPARPLIPKHITRSQEKLSQYHLWVPEYWNGHFASNDLDSTERIEEVINDLRGLAPYVPDPQQQHIKELLCQYHQLALNHARDSGDFDIARESVGRT